MAAARRSGALDERTVARAVETACLTELDALKPGNVHVHADGHQMSVDDFVRSAAVAAEALARPGPGVGARILAAVTATQRAVGCNTNLGIVLLCAPLAQAALAPDPDEPLARRVARVLADLGVEDAVDAFAAIRLAGPAGLGRPERHDVAERPSVSLLAAMEEAQSYDRIARQYATGFADVFGLGARRIRDMRARLRPEADYGPADIAAWAASAAYLGFLAAFADTHLSRKYGPARAEEVRRRALALDADLTAARRPEALTRRLLDFDSALKREKINPGTSADLTVASLLAVDLEDILADQTAS